MYLPLYDLFAISIIVQLLQNDGREYELRTETRIAQQFLFI